MMQRVVEAARKVKIPFSHSHHALQREHVRLRR